MANQIDRITKVQIQQQDQTFGQPYAVGAEARFVTMSDGSDVQTVIDALQLSNRKNINQLARKGKQLVITRVDDSTATLDLLWDKNTDKIAGIVDATGGTANKGKVWKVGNDGKPGWGVQDKTKTSELDVFKPATSAVAGVKGLVPAPEKGQQARYLRGDAKWVTPPGTVKNAIGQAGYVDATTTANAYYNTFWSVGHAPAGSTKQTNFPAWRRNDICFVGATSNVAGLAGLVPAPAKGQQGKFLKGDGTWGDPPKSVWRPNTKDQDGYVIKPGNITNSFWGINKNGVLGWTNFKDVNLYNEGNFCSANKNRNLFLCGDGTWRDINAIVSNDIGTKVCFARWQVEVTNRTMTALSNDANDWKLLTLNGASMKGHYMAIANVSVDTRRSNGFPGITGNVINNNSYICSNPLEGYLRAVVNITDDVNQNKKLTDNEFGKAPSQNTITKYGGSVTTCYEWYYDGSKTKYIYLAAEYNATRALLLCYNVIILKVA